MPPATPQQSPASATAATPWFPMLCLRNGTKQNQSTSSQLSSRCWRRKVLPWTCLRLICKQQAKMSRMSVALYPMLRSGTAPARPGERAPAGAASAGLIQCWDQLDVWQNSCIDLMSTSSRPPHVTHPWPHTHAKPVAFAPLDADESSSRHLCFQAVGMRCLCDMHHTRGARQLSNYQLVPLLPLLAPLFLLIIPYCLLPARCALFPANSSIPIPRVSWTALLCARQ